MAGEERGWLQRWVVVAAGEEGRIAVVGHIIQRREASFSVSHKDCGASCLGVAQGELPICHC